MLNNDILRRMRYALKINDETMLELFQLGGQPIDLSRLLNTLKKEDEENYSPLNDKYMTAFLDGLIIKRRGVRENSTDAPVKAEIFNNNLILRKIKIALEFKEDDLLAVLKRAEMEISKSELSALFRNKDHKHYKECGDQFLRSFLAGLAGYKRAKPFRTE